MSGKSKSNIAKKLAFERKLAKDGSTNLKYVDLLEVDKPIAGQTFGCFSFITPEKILKQKEAIHLLLLFIILYHKKFGLEILLMGLN